MTLRCGVRSLLPPMDLERVAEKEERERAPKEFRIFGQMLVYKPTLSVKGSAIFRVAEYSSYGLCFELQYWKNL